MDAQTISSAQVFIMKITALGVFYPYGKVKSKRMSLLAGTVFFHGYILVIFDREIRVLE